MNLYLSDSKVYIRAALLIPNPATRNKARSLKTNLTSSGCSKLQSHQYQQEETDEQEIHLEH